MPAKAFTRTSGPAWKLGSLLSRFDDQDPLAVNGKQHAVDFIRPVSTSSASCSGREPVNRSHGIECLRPHGETCCH